MHTKGPWTSKMWDSVNYAIRPANPKHTVLICLAQAPGVGGPVSDKERAANIRLIEEAPIMFDALLKAHDLSLDGKHEEAREVMLFAVEKVTEERQAHNY